MAVLISSAGQPGECGWAVREKRKNLENASSAELATLVRDMVGSRAGIVHASFTVCCATSCVLRPRFSMQLDAQSADDLENRVWRYTDRRMRGMIETQGQDPLLGKIVQRLVDACQPERIYLFGSRARGDGGADSDYDIMVVVAQSDEPAYRRAQRAHSLLWDLGAAADILVWTRDAFDSRVHLRASLPATIAREGRVLYVA